MRPYQRQDSLYEKRDVSPSSQPMPSMPHHPITYNNTSTIYVRPNLNGSTTAVL